MEKANEAVPEVRFQAKPNCKTCYGRGFVTRTMPTGRKQMVQNQTLCHCVIEIAPPEKRESIISDEEVVVPKVKPKVKTYASQARPESNN